MKKPLLRKPLCFIISVIFAICSVTLYPVIASAEGGSQGTFTQYLPTPSGGVSWHFDRPHGMITDTYGNIYVADTHNNRVQKLNANGELITQWGSRGSGDGDFDYVTGITLGPGGNVYTLDCVGGDLLGQTNSNFVESRVQVFDSNGGFIRKWTFDTDGTITEGIVIDSEGNIFITYGEKILKYDNNGSPIKEWNCTGGARGIAIDSIGYLYVASEKTIRKYDREGALVTEWGSAGKGNGQFDSPWGISVDKLGYVYVTDSELCRVQKFTTAGRFIQKWSRPGNPRMLEVYSIAADDFGNVYVGENLGLFKFTNKGAVLARWSSVSDKNSTFFFVSDVAFDSKDNMYVVDRNNYRIQKFDKNGAFLAKWNTRRPGDNVRDTFPCSIAINSKDMVYLTNEKYRRVDVYSSTGTFIKSWPIADEGLTEFYGTGGMVFDKDDNLYIPSYKCIQVYDGNGNILTRLTATEEVADDNMVFGGRDLAFGPDGYLYILSYDRVIVYQKDGTFVRQWQVGAGQFGYPFGITLDSEGHVYVVEYSNYRVSEFDNEGKLITRWGKKGSGDNQFNCAVIVECDHRDNVYVCDSNNSRIMKKPANSGPVPSIDYVSLGTSPNLGFAPGGSNHLPIDVGVSAKAQAELRAYVFNSKGVWVAQIGMTIDKSGNYSFDWDGKATTGNPAGLAAGKLVPSSSGGTKYTIRAFVQNEHGSVWSTVQTLKFYSSSKVKWIGVSSPLISAGQKTTFTYQIAHFSNVEVRILDAKGKIAAKFRSDTVFPGRSISQAWDGKTTEGNTMGLEPGNAVPAGKYTVQIRAGNTIYNAKNKITVY